MRREDVIRDVLQAADEFIGRKLWRQFTNYDCFGVRIAGQDELMLGVVLGDAGEEYGLSLLRGPQAAATLTELLSPEGPSDDTLEEIDTLGFSMEVFGDLSGDMQSLIRQAGQHPRDDEPVPSFLVKPAGGQGRLPNESELALLGQVLRAIVNAYDNKMIKPATLEDEEGICVVHVSGGSAEPDVSVTRERIEQEERSVTRPRPATDSDLHSVPHLKATWLVGMPALPAVIDGDDRAMQMLLVVDEASGLVLQGKPVFSGDLKKAASSLVDTFRGHGLKRVQGLPRKIIFSSHKLHEAMTPMLEALGVQCSFSASIPKLQAIMEEFYDLLGDLAPFETGVEAGDQEEVPIPAPDDLKGWKEADKRLFNRFVDHFEREDRLWGARPVRRYFADEDLEYYIQEHEQEGVLMAYTAWGILDYRPTKNSKTHAEKMLEAGLSGPEAVLLRARMEAHPTLYRVAAYDAKAGTLDLEDVLLGGCVTVYDQAMSENIQKGLFLTARAFPAGHFHFVEVAGPILSAAMGLEAVDFLRESRMKFTPEGLRKDAHKFGWLWGWMDEWQARWRPPHMRNTDGDELLWHTASFSVDDPQRIRGMLMQREDVDYDEQEDEFVWSKDAGPNSAMPGGRVTLGPIEFVGDELVLTVNSAERFARGRKWLEALPGVAFKGVTTRPWDIRPEDLPLDDRIGRSEPMKITPEIESSLRDLMNKHHMAWIDTPVPALGGKTPRQACETEQGCQKVLTLIRTMPDPMGPVAIEIPRQAMMAELGLTEETSRRSARSQKPETPIPIREVSPRPKAARNAPCPCGSGHKYKKCCGREHQQK